MHFTASEVLATLELGRLMERGEIPRCIWEYMNPGEIEYGEWEAPPRHFETARKVRLMRRRIEFHGWCFIVRMHFVGHQLGDDEGGEVKSRGSFWAIWKVEVGNRIDSIHREARPHPPMKTLWQESMRRSYDAVNGYLDLPKVLVNNRIILRKK